MLKGIKQTYWEKTKKGLISYKMKISFVCLLPLCLLLSSMAVLCNINDYGWKGPINWEIRLGRRINDSKKPISFLDLFISIHLAGGFLFGKNHLWILRLVEIPLVELTVSFLLLNNYLLTKIFQVLFLYVCFLQECFYIYLMKEKV